MIFDHDPIGNGIRRQGVHPRRVRYALNHQPAIGVIAAGGADRIDERLIIIHQRDLFRSIVHVWFVRGGKKQMVVITGKIGGDLRPIGLHLRVDDGINIVRNVVFQPAIVPMIVNHDIHSRSDGRIHCLLDLRHVRGTDYIVGDAAADVGGGIEIPRAGNAHGVEPGVSGSIERCGGITRNSPRGLQCISQIPSVSRNRPWHGGWNVRWPGTQTQIEHRVKLVAAAGGDRAASGGNHRNFAASIGVR